MAFMWKASLEAQLNAAMQFVQRLPNFAYILQITNTKLGRAIETRNVPMVAEAWQNACMLHQCVLAAQKIAEGQKWYGEISTILMLEEPFTAPLASALARFLEETARAKNIKVSELISLMMRVNDWRYGPYDVLDLIAEMLTARPHKEGSRAARRFMSYKLNRLWDTFERTCPMQSNKILYFESFMTVQLAARDILHELPNPTVDSILTALQARPFQLRKLPYHRFENGGFIKFKKVKKLCGLILKTTLQEMADIANAN